MYKTSVYTLVTGNI